MVNVVVTGAVGRMGTQIIRLVRATEGMAVSGAVERPGFPAGTDAGVAAGLGPIGVPVGDDLGKALAAASVVVDFTSHEASARHAEICAEKGVALVVGSTGFTPETKARVAAAAQRLREPPRGRQGQSERGGERPVRQERRRSAIEGDAAVDQPHDPVRAGQTVAVMDTSDYQSQLQQAQAGRGKRFGQCAVKKILRDSQVVHYHTSSPCLRYFALRAATPRLARVSIPK